MGKLFGTDGIRGKANVYPINPDLALRLGKAIAAAFGAKGKGKTLAIIGKDTRLSGYMLETALTSGMISMGMDVYMVGPMPTPAVALLAKSMIADVGIMITASHNPAEDNGIKIFDGNGYKLPDDVEAKIEKLLLSEEEINPADPTKMGKAFRIDDAGGRYIERTKACIGQTNLRGLKVVLDCAHGAGYHLNPLIFKELGVDVIKTNTSPDGLNINQECGALYPEKMGAMVRAHGADCGIAFDGDADRVIFCDAAGEIVNGDKIIAMCAKDLKEQGRLKNDTVVVTSMTNLGFHKSMEEDGIDVVITDVGDRYVIETMRQGGFVLGGEQSGHIIFNEHSTTGDGALGGLMVLSLMKRTGRTLAELAECMEVFPQKLTNIMVSSKPPLESLTKVQATLQECEAALGSSGRCVLRYSGTESKLRVLLEAEKHSDVDFWTDKFIAAVKSELG
ncbi:MAG: phosphoglucosamine mutase [Lentisphaerales bacterium]|nr:phosphoglucosamine mutase [Lentisphaerales bacterium]